MRALAIFVLVVVSGCGERDCSDTRLNGSYLTTFKTLSGNCGDIPTTIQFFADGQEQMNAGCVTMAKSESDDRCEADGTVVCTDSANSLRITSVMHMEVEEDGSRVTGTVTYSITDLSSRAICMGTYELESERQ